MKLQLNKRRSTMQVLKRGLRGDHTIIDMTLIDLKYPAAMKHLYSSQPKAIMIVCSKLYIPE